MRLISKIKGKIDDLFRVAVAESDDLAKRATKQQDLLDRLRGLPEFEVLLDHFDGELRAMLRSFFKAQTAKEALDIWHEAKAFARMQARLEQGVYGKARGEAAEEAYLRRQVELLKADQTHMRQVIEARGRQAQNGWHA